MVTSTYWTFFWTAEFIVLVGTALVWILPHRKAKHAARSATLLHEQAVEYALAGRDIRHVNTLFAMSHQEWEDCFLWHALARRIQKVTVPLSMTLALMATVRLAVVL